MKTKEQILKMTPEEHLDAAISYADTHLIKDTKKRTAQRNFPRDFCTECKRVTGTDTTTGNCGGCLLKPLVEAQRHELHDTPWAWLAAPLLLLALLVVGWVRMKIGI